MLRPELSTQDWLISAYLVLTSASQTVGVAWFLNGLSSISTSESSRRFGNRKPMMSTSVRALPGFTGCSTKFGNGQASVQPEVPLREFLRPVMRFSLSASRLRVSHVRSQGRSLSEEVLPRGSGPRELMDKCGLCALLTLWGLIPPKHSEGLDEAASHPGGLLRKDPQ